MDPHPAAARGPADGDANAIDGLRTRLRSLQQVTIAGEARPSDFLRYLECLDAKVPAELDIHLALQWLGYSVHKDPSVQDWLSCRPRFFLHLASRIDWLHFVECWLDLIAGQWPRCCDRRGSPDGSVD